MAPGDLISHYRILSRLGQGGMGQVWLAEDTVLGRRVALKIIWPHLALDPEGTRRFEQEGKAVAALNHPNIAHIHETGEAGGMRFLAMEFVDGVRLSERIDGRPLPLRDVVEIGIQLAEALDEAHSKGITHRDIKPGNVMLTERGQVKVLDFGLAKIRRLGDGETAGSTQTITSPGEVVGTLRYMSPEQALGTEVDHRSDLFSLGAVLYEMATGKQAFPGANPTSVYDCIINREPVPASQVNRALHPQVDQIIQRAMEKDRELRYQTASDLCADLKRVKRDIETRRAPALPRRRLVLAGGALILLAAAGTAWKFAPRSSPPSTGPIEVKPLTSYPGSESQPSFSPDGNQIAFAWNAGTEDNWDIYVKVVDAGAPLRLTNNPATDHSPAWSPDGRYIAFLRQSDESDSGFYMVPALGGLERRLTSASPHRVGVDAPYVTWAPDGKRLALVDKPAPEQPMCIWLLDIGSGQRKQVTFPPAKTYGDSGPAFSPDGRQIVFVRTGSLGIMDLYVTALAGGEPRRLTFDSRRIYGVTWNPADGRILFASPRGGSSRLWRMAVGGSPERILGAGENASFLAIARNGNRLAYTRGSLDPNVWRYSIPGPSRSAEPPRSLITSTRHEQGPQYSPDGERIVFASTRSGNWEIWWCDREGRNPSQLTSFGGPTAGSPYWSPDGQQIVFDARPGGNPDVYVIDTKGGAPRRMTTDPSEEIVPTWSRDGKWIYFASNRTFAYEIWKMPATGGAAVQVTRQGGFHGIESPDGKILYYVKSPNLPGLWRVPVDGGEEKPVLESFRPGFWGYWAIANKGIYFLERQELEDRGIRYHLSFCDFAGKRIRQVLPFERRPFNSGISISPDGRWCLYTQVDHSDTDIMLVDNFR